MHALISNVTAAVLFVHTVVGCCWHHAHASELARGSGATVSHARCCHHEHTGEPGKQRLPAGEHESCEGDCSYVLSQKVRIDAPMAVMALDCCLVLPSVGVGQADACGTRVSVLALDHTPAPVRAHLLHQSLLN